MATAAALLAVLGGEFADDGALGHSRVHVRAAGEQQLLSGLGGEAAAGDEPAQSDRGAARSTGFAVDVDRVTLGGMSIDELDRAFDVGERRRIEVGRRDSQLFDAGGRVGLGRSGVFLARVHDRSHALGRQARDVALERQRAEHDVRVDSVPPAAHAEHSAEKHVPKQRRDEQQASDYARHRASRRQLATSSSTCSET